MTQMMIKSPVSDPSMAMLFRTTAPNESIILPIVQYDYDTNTVLMSYDFVVDWGDGSQDTITAYNQAEATHSYASAGDHVVSIEGICDSLRFEWGNYASGASYLKIIEIQSWGDVPFVELAVAFAGCTNLSITATDSPNLSALGNWSALFVMFHQCVFVDGGIKNWDVSKIPNHSLQRFLSGLQNYNEDLSSLDVSTITNMRRLFISSPAFNNNNLTGWDVSSVVDMQEVFLSTNFNGDLSGWNTGSVTTMVGMFQSSPFNQDISAWDVSKVLTMQSMFSGASAFNQDISSWNVGEVTTMRSMFANASAFNQDLPLWDTSKLTSLYQTFSSASAFNGDISGWDVSKVTSFFASFSTATSFNQDVSSWDVSAGLEFSSMFNNATSFSTTNYDLLLNAWSLLTLSPNETIHFASTYTIATSQAARDILTGAPNNWSITDGGGI